MSSYRLEFNLAPTSGNPTARPLEFTWDPETGEVSGPGAEAVLDRATWAEVQGHPMPRTIELGPDPLRSWRDMAAIVGSEWRLPPELGTHYPQLEDDAGDPSEPVTY